MTHSAKKPIHKWRVLDTPVVDGVEFFQYQCSKCKTTTLNGEPLQKPYSEKCGDKNA